MDRDLKIVGIAGSLRTGSLNRALLNTLVQLAPMGLAITVAEISDVPLYNGDVEEHGIPAPVAALAELIRQADGLLLVTPEYNASVPAAIKNAIDWLSRASVRAPLSGKPVGILGASPGLFGTVRAQIHLRQILANCDARVMTKPEVFVGQAHTKFDAEGQLTDEVTKEHLANFLASLNAWCRKG